MLTEHYQTDFRKQDPVLSYKRVQTEARGVNRPLKCRKNQLRTSLADLLRINES